MTVTPEDLFTAILAMDSYNRGYGAGISDSAGNDTNGLGGGGSLIGSATVGGDELLPTGSQAAGFYALAYSWNGKTVISYRGTNFADGAPATNDVVNGWAIAPGDFMASQFALSTKFLSSVAQTTNPDNIVLTGHSLGGALARR